MTIFDDYSDKALTFSRFRVLGVKNFAKKAAFTFLTIGAGLGFFGSSETKAQSTRDLEQVMAGDTLWTNGWFQAVNTQTMDVIPGIHLNARPTQMSMYVPDFDSTYITGPNGQSPFLLPVYMDSTVSIIEFLKSNTLVFPVPGSEMNAYFPSELEGTISFYDMKGILAESQEFKGDHAYANLSKLKIGAYAYKITTNDGVEFGGKFIKNNAPIKGPAGQRPSTGFKSGNMLETATYMMSWHGPGVKTDSIEVQLTEGYMGIVNLFMEPIAGIPQHQDFTGTVRDGSNNNAPIANTLVTLEDVVSGDTLWMFTGSDGTFSFNNLDLDKQYIFNVGNVSGKQSHKDSYCSTPIEITVASDTAINLTDVFLLDLDGLSTQHIKDHTSNGSQQGVIQYYLGDSYTETQKTWLRNSMVQFQSSENNTHILEESLTQLNGTGINIEYGTNNTQTDEEAIVTPFGTLYRVISATSTMGTGNYATFVHEIKRALGIDEVTWYSVMRSDAPEVTTEDNNIGMFEGKYWKNMYDGMTNLDLNTITDTIPIPAAARAFKENGSKGKFNNYNKNLPTSKYMNN